ncbi:unnamed protein product [Psylliodes chrysocephalus]|uniref:Uncharacterized protein n=1 Tax=Psylliodes chrysocephalus TaxID=3402493 RepID=A0A9P0G727_9CUCU|nr:unnamed protein product [Psylliodes chrysocephala]
MDQSTPPSSSKSKEEHVLPPSKKRFTPEPMRHLPKADFSKPKNVGRQTGNTAVLTDTPKKMLIEQRLADKKTKSKRAEKRKPKYSESSSLCLVRTKQAMKTGYSVDSVENGHILNV